MPKKLSRPPALLHDPRLADLEAAAEASPSSRAALLALASAYNARCMADEARRTCDRLLELDPSDGDAWHEALIARSFLGPGALKAVQPRVSQLVASNAKAAWAHRNLGLLAYYRDRDEESRRALARALELDPSDSRAHEALAYLAYTIGDLDGAVEAGIKAVEHDGRNHRALHWLGECYVRLDAPDQAIRYLQRCLQIEGCYFFALESLGTLYLADPATAAHALQCFSRLFAASPDHFPAHFRLADALIQAERLTEAEAAVETALAIASEDTVRADAHQYLGLISLLRGEPARAKDELMRALSIDDQFAAAHHYLGVVAEQEGQPLEAEARYRRAVELDPENSLPRVRLGYLCFDRKQYANARRHFEAAIQVDDTEAMAWLGLSEIARWRKDFAEQLSLCQRAAELSPDDPNVHNQLGTAHDALGQEREARAAYEKALELDPRNRQAANNLGYLLERMLRSARPSEAPGLKRAAVAAWKVRLLACRDTGASTRGARAHLEKLGVGASRIDSWLASEE